MFKLTIDTTAVIRRMEAAHNQIIATSLVAMKHAIKPTTDHWIKNIPYEVPKSRFRARQLEGVRRLKDSLTVTIKRWTNNRGVVSIVRPKHRLAHIIESGTKPRYHKSGHYTGIGPAFLTMKNAVEETSVSVANRFRTVMMSGGVKEV